MLSLFKLENLRHLLLNIRVCGVKSTLRKALSHIEDELFYHSENLYMRWIKKTEPDAKDLEKQKNGEFNYAPKISLIVPVFDLPTEFISSMIDSVLVQTYSNWELCMACYGLNDNPRIRQTLEAYAEKDLRIKIKYLKRDEHISESLNEILSLVTGDFVALLNHNDTLAPFALFEMTRVVNQNLGADFIYSDEDKITENSEARFEPHFKPDFSPDTLRSHNYIGHLAIISKQLFDTVGQFRRGYDGSQDYDLMLRATEKAKKILHIPMVLYHCRVRQDSAATIDTADMKTSDSAKKALRDHLKRTNLDGDIVDGPLPYHYKIHYKIKNDPLVSIIIPNRDHAEDLRKCVNSVFKKSTYRNFEIIIVENASSKNDTFKLYDELKKSYDIRILEWNEPFNFSMINNYAVPQATGEFLLFLNNDTEVINSDWLERMIEYAQRKDVGAVGAKLYYPNDTIQHAGIILGGSSASGHAHHFFPRSSSGYLGRLQVVQNLSAVTAACLMVRREIFNEARGFDKDYALAFGDVDFCLKIREKGYLVVFTPFAELYHHESKTRGYEDTAEKFKRFKKEIALFKNKWDDLLKKGDPYYSPNLTLKREDLSIRI